MPIMRARSWTRIFRHAGVDLLASLPALAVRLRFGSVSRDALPARRVACPRVSLLGRVRLLRCVGLGLGDDLLRRARRSSDSLNARLSAARKSSCIDGVGTVFAGARGLVCAASAASGLLGRPVLRPVEDRAAPSSDRRPRPAAGPRRDASSRDCSVPKPACVERRRRSSVRRPGTVVEVELASVQRTLGVSSANAAAACAPARRPPRP